MIEVIEDREALVALKPAWDALAHGHGSPLLSHDWFMSCLETVNATQPVRVVVLRDAGDGGGGRDIRAIAPLCLERQPSGTVLAMIGVSVLYEPSGFLYTDPDSLHRLLQGVIGLGLPLSLLRMPDDPHLHDSLDRLAWTRAIVYRRPSAPSAFLALPDTWDTFLAGLSASRRRDLRRKLRLKCLERSGQVSLRIVDPAPGELSELLRQAMAVEDAGWKGRNGSSLLKRADLREFFSRYTGRACEAGVLRLCYLDVDGMPVSMHIAIEANGAFWVLKMGYDEALSKCSPGSQLAMDTIEFSVRRQLSRYEFLGVEEDWQHAWPVQRHAHFTVLICPYSLSGLKGAAGLFMAAARKLLRSRNASARP
ncbi:MAG: GNAT family N-acetyltransferase [Gammaproteobacteria bacterium]